MNVLHFISTNLISVLAVVVTFGLVIFLHELGHFILCRILKIRVEAFAFGFGPEIWSREKDGTKYIISWIPLGGYVKPAGETLDAAKGAPDEFFSKPWYDRVLVHLAGPAMNYILAFVLFTSVIWLAGMPIPTSDAVLGEMHESYPAYLSGLREGDRIVEVDGRKVSDWMQMAEIIHARAGKKLDISYARAGKQFHTSITPIMEDGEGHIGISPAMVTKYVGLGKSASMGAFQCWFWTHLTIKTLATKIYHREKPDLTGPVGIVHMVSKAAHSGFADLVFLIALISVAVGVFNLLPIPVLDGGQSLLFIWEGISRRKLTEKVFVVANSMGFAFLVCVLVFATYGDLVRLFSNHGVRPEAVQSTDVKK